MKTTRTSGPNEWRNIGKRCASLGWSIDRALTNKEGIDKLIREGFDEQTKRLNRRALTTEDRQAEDARSAQFDPRGD